MLHTNNETNMENYFRLTEETKVNVFGITLFRIELTKKCKWGNVGDKGGGG